MFLIFWCRLKHVLFRLTPSPVHSVWLVLEVSFNPLPRIIPNKFFLRTFGRYFFFILRMHIRPHSYLSCLMSNPTESLHNWYVPLEFTIWLVDAWYFDCFNSNLRQAQHLDVYYCAQQLVENSFKLSHFIPNIHLWFWGFMLFLLPRFFTVVYTMVVALDSQQFVWVREHDLDRSLQILLAQAIYRCLEALFHCEELLSCHLTASELDFLILFTPIELSNCYFYFSLPRSSATGSVKLFLPFEPLIDYFLEFVVIFTFTFVWLRLLFFPYLVAIH